MPPNTKQPDTAAFLTSYGKTLHAFSLPERLSDKYTLINCIKHSSEKEFYLLSDSVGKQYLLKKTSGHSSQLRQEYTMLLKLAKCGTPLAIPVCIDFWEEQDFCYLLRTYIPGYSLVEYTEKHFAIKTQNGMCEGFFPFTHPVFSVSLLPTVLLHCFGLFYFTVFL